MQINVPSGSIGSCRPSGKKRLLLVLKAGSVLVTGALLVASCASSTSDQQQTSTEVPATTASAPPPQSAAPDADTAMTACVGELAAVASSENVSEEEIATMTGDWEVTCTGMVSQLNQVAQSARQFGADSACVDRVLANAMTAPFAFFNAFAASTEGAPEGEATWGQFSECMPQEVLYLE